MRKLLASLVLLAALSAFAGCKNDGEDDNMMNDENPRMSDACAACPGDQMVGADGTCSGCGKKM